MGENRPTDALDDVLPSAFDAFLAAVLALLSDPEFLVLILIVFVSFVLQAALGFGGNILAVSWGAYFIDPLLLVPMLVPGNLLTNAYILFRYPGDVDRPLLLRTLIPAIAIGFAAGFALTFVLEGVVLKLLLGIFVAATSIYSLVRSLQNAPPPQIGVASEWSLLIGGGVFQGAYGTGGPLIVLAVSALQLSRAAFRSTLVVIWIIFNSALFVLYAAAGRVGLEVLAGALIFSATVLVAIPAGELLHHRLNETLFRRVVFVMLIFAGLVLIVKSVGT